MQQTNEIKNVHIKVQCDNEFRRFVLSEVTYVNLSDMIRSLLGFPVETTFKLSYLDDESDWVLFTTDDELQYACALSKSPLKISVKLCTGSQTSASPAAIKFTFPPLPTVANDDKTGFAVADENTWRGRGGMRRGGRGCRGGKRGEWRNNNSEFRLRVDAKIARLTDRHAALTAKFIESDLPEEKARGLEWRLCHLQNKIDMLKAKKEAVVEQQQLGDASAVINKEEHQNNEEATPIATPTPLPRDDEGEEEEEDHHGWHRRGRRGGGGRGGRRGGCRRGEDNDCDEEEEEAGGRRGGGRRGGCGPQAFACTTPEGKAAFERLQACKDAVMAARREKAGKEAIMSKIVELKAAKADWKELKLALWKENRAAATACPKKEAK
jgi:hypothetical protein